MPRNATALASLLLALAWLDATPATAAPPPDGDAPTAVPAAGAFYTYAPATRDGRGKYYMGRELAQTMTWHGIPWLERPERRREEKPDRVVEHMDLRPDDVVADIGAGSGYFTLRIAGGSNGSKRSTSCPTNTSWSSASLGRTDSTRVLNSMSKATYRFTSGNNGAGVRPGNNARAERRNDHSTVN